MVQYNPLQVTALEMVNALMTVAAMSIIVTGMSAGLLASGIFEPKKVPKKPVGITWAKPKK